MMFVWLRVIGHSCGLWLEVGANLLFNPIFDTKKWITTNLQFQFERIILSAFLVSDILHTRGERIKLVPRDKRQKVTYLLK